jgi:hypothetical protein
LNPKKKSDRYENNSEKTKKQTDDSTSLVWHLNPTMDSACKAKQKNRPKIPPSRTLHHHHIHRVRSNPYVVFPKIWKKNQRSDRKRTPDIYHWTLEKRNNLSS